MNGLPSKDKIIVNGESTPEELDEKELPTLEANFTQIPNAVWDKWLPLFKTLSEMKVVHYLLRHTYGYKKSFDCLSLKDFCEGAKNKKGEPIDLGTGLARSSANDGLKAACKHGFILRYKYGRPGQEEVLYFINNKHSKVLLRMLDEGDISPEQLISGMKMEQLHKKYPGMGQYY